MFPGSRRLTIQGALFPHAHPGPCLSTVTSFLATDCQSRALPARSCHYVADSRPTQPLAPRLPCMQTNWKIQSEPLPWIRGVLVNSATRLFLLSILVLSISVSLGAQKIATNPTSLSFNATVGGAATSQSLSVDVGQVGTSFSVAASTTSGGHRLAV